jgi:hypothetical protein
MYWVNGRVSGRGKTDGYFLRSRRFEFKGQAETGNLDWRLKAG